LPGDSSLATPVPHGDTADAVEDISVAIELKFLVPLLPLEAQRYNHHGAAPRGVVALACSVDEAALANQAYELIAQSIRRTAGQRSITLPEILRIGCQERDFWETHWIVKKANSGEPRDDDGTDSGCHWIPVEICSPKLRWNEPRVQRAVGAVLRALDTNHGIVANYTCDAHVHVGRLDGRPFRLNTLKRLATILWLAEDMLRSIRNPSSPNFHNVYTWGAEVRKHSRLAEALGHDSFLAEYHSAAKEAGAAIDPTGLESEEYHAINAIWAAQSPLELGRMLSGSSRQYRRLGFNFSSFGEEDERAKQGPKTIEFRVLEGTLRNDVVLPWTSICHALVETATVGEKGQFQFQDVVACLLEEGPGGCRGPGATAEHRLTNFIDCLGIGHGMAGAFLDNIRRDRIRPGSGLGKEDF
jgi:hypothetical protein